MGKSSKVPRLKSRSLEESVIILCRLHRRIQDRNFGIGEMNKRKYLRDTMRRLAAHVDGEYYDLQWMLKDGEADAHRVQSHSKP